MPGKARDLRAGEPLSQYGNTEQLVGLRQDRAFRGRPRPADQGKLSVELGRYTVEEFLERCPNFPKIGATIRHTTVGALCERGFVVYHDPRGMRPEHVSVEFPGDWDDAIEERFDDAWELPQEGEA